MSKSANKKDSLLANVSISQASVLCLTLEPALECTLVESEWRMNGNAYRIGEVAAKTGLTPDALRYYERRGLLTPTARTAGGFRLYGSEILERVRFILQAQSLGLALDEIRELVEFNGGEGLKRCERVRDLLRAKVGELEHKLKELRVLRRTLKASLNQCEQTIQRQSAADCPLREVH